MDYEKMYKAVLKTATQWIKDGCSDKEKICLESIFPQLRESEDERIRKLLVWQVYRNIEDETNDLAGSVYDGIKGHDPDLEESIEDWKKCLAYLEKHKEQKPAQSEEEKEYVRTLKGLVSDFIRDSGGGITDVEYYQNICDWLDGRHIEQKPVEYLSKDKVYAIMNKLTVLSLSELIPLNSDEYKKIHEITFDVRSLLDYPIEQKPRWEINNPHTTKWTKEMIDEKFEELVEEYHKQKPVVTHGETYHVDTLGTQQVIAGKMPQKPAEWSEEDDWKRKELIQYLEEKGDYRTVWMTWLKSLRPQWKPSEEQMSMLLAVINDPNNAGAESCYMALKSIYNNLKKL